MRVIDRIVAAQQAWEVRGGIDVCFPLCLTCGWRVDAGASAEQWAALHRDLTGHTRFHYR